MDATVYYGVKDFRFQNDTPFPLKVQASVSGRSLTVNLLGTKSDNITVEMTNQIVGTTGYNTVYQIDESLPAGSTKVKTTPYTGYTVKGLPEPLRRGRPPGDPLESTSVYRARDKVVLVSPADAASTACNPPFRKGTCYEKTITAPAGDEIPGQAPDDPPPVHAGDPGAGGGAGGPHRPALPAGRHLHLWRGQLGPVRGHGERACTSTTTASACSSAWTWTQTVLALPVSYDQLLRFGIFSLVILLVLSPLRLGAMENYWNLLRGQHAGGVRSA